MNRLMSVAQQHSLIFNPDKCGVNVRKINFFGCICDTYGFHPYPGKVEAINVKTVPTSVTELQSFWGSVQYMSSFIPQLADLTEPLRLLTHKDVKSEWNASHDQAFRKIKDGISE